MVFVGESWKGSCARSLREALAALPGVDMDDVGEDHYFPNGRSWVVRAVKRLLGPWSRLELEDAVSAALDGARPDVLMVYKGSEVSAATLRLAKRIGVFTVNVFPDCSPHAHGARLKAMVGEYDLVVSTKPFHPAGWRTIYGYGNRCVCVPHGYDPAVHYWPNPPGQADFDVVLAATWRPEYQSLMQQLAARMAGHPLTVGIIGSGWSGHLAQLPSHWKLSPALRGRSYGDWLRRGRIVVAPVNGAVTVRGERQPGDEDTTRTYELGAMGCFFLHRRTPYVQTVYDEASEVPMWDDAEELAAQVRRYLPLEDERRAMAARAHARAVPAYSIQRRAAQVLEQVKSGMHTPPETSR